ncbi:MAG TPA: alpha/beta hydrolase [Gaiellaceae bacterium]|jgi:proline iminopeptidase|nr:alpha/beta hydrolase [Gaiellaceae bacterium]
MHVQADAARIFVDVEGPKLRADGSELREVPTVAIVHTGPGNDHTPYREHIGPVLAEELQVLYVDLRGFGRSDLSEPDRWHVAQWAEDLHVVFETLGVERPVILGAGWGAFTALRYAQEWPDALSKLVLVNPVARVVVPRMVAAFDEAGGPAAGEAAFTFYEHPSELSIANYMRECFHLMVGAKNAQTLMLDPIWSFPVAVHWVATEARTIDLRPGLERVTVPTLIAAGTADPQHPLASIEEVVEALPHATVRWYEGARHSIFRDRPEVNEQIRGWILRPGGE